MIREERIFIPSDNLIIEALFHRSSGKKAAILCHPHPLMGGSMHNNVVEASIRAWAAENIATARFNFRGVGASSGAYDEGRGEARDVISVYRFLQQQGYSNIYFAGYSFGAWVGSKIIQADNKIFDYAVFISPPDNYFVFDYGRLINKVDLIICGNADAFCDAAKIYQKSKSIGAKLEIIDGADHFYWGKEAEIEKIMRLSVGK